MNSIYNMDVFPVLSLGSSYRPHTLRQTQVMVIPGNENISNEFQVFDNFINAVNTARRNARDYITDANLEKLDQELAGEPSREWRLVLY